MHLAPPAQQAEPAHFVTLTVAFTGKLTFRHCTWCGYCVGNQESKRLEVVDRDSAADTLQIKPCALEARAGLTTPRLSKCSGWMQTPDVRWQPNAQ